MSVSPRLVMPLFLISPVFLCNPHPHPLHWQVFLARLLPIPLPTADSATDGDEESRTILQRFFVPVPKTGTVEMLKAKLSQLCGIPAEQLCVADVFKGR